MDRKLPGKRGGWVKTRGGGKRFFRFNTPEGVGSRTQLIDGNFAEVIGKKNRPGREGTNERPFSEGQWSVNPNNQEN